MIIKKPYAFLIRNFRLVHGLLFCVLLYLAVRTTSIYGFVNSYATTKSYQMQTVLASDYVDFYMFGACVVAILIAMVIYYHKRISILVKYSFT